MQHYLEQLYDKFYKTKLSEAKIQLIYLIIGIKVQYECQDYKCPLYIDIKKFIKYYLKSRANKDYGYDEYNSQKIISCIHNVDKYKQLELLVYVKRHLQSSFEPTDWVDEQISNVKKDLYKQKHNYFLWILYCCTDSLLKMCLTIMFVFILTFLFLLPAFCDCMVLYQIEYAELTSNFYLNHIINVLALFFDLDIGCKLICLNCFSVLVYLIVRFLSFVVVGNFLYQKIMQKLTFS